MCVCVCVCVCVCCVCVCVCGEQQFSSAVALQLLSNGFILQHYTKTPQIPKQNGFLLNVNKETHTVRKTYVNPSNATSYAYCLNGHDESGQVSS